VLGALSDEERSAFEAHLATCAECRARVEEVAPVARLLAGLPAGAYEPAADTPPDTLLPAPLRAARRKRWPRRWFLSAATALAAACLVALVVVLAWPSGHGTGPTPRAMTPVASSPVHATAALVSRAWGTEIDLACRCEPRCPPRAEYSLLVIDHAGAASPAGSWTLVPGQVTKFTAGTALPRGEIAKLEIAVGNQPILQLTL
jgi:hypothetical protein